MVSKRQQKTNKWQGMQLRPMNTTNASLKTPKKDGRMLDATNKCGTVCHGMSKPLLI